MKHKTAIVTGASSGIGEATAVRLAELGVQVFAVARRKERLQALAKREANIVPVELDVTGSLQPLAEAVGSTPIDILINNAGGAHGRDPIDTAKRDDWQTMIDVNLTALIAVTQWVVPGMKQRRRGDVVNIGSIAAFEWYAGGSVYCATKAAVNALTKAWREDLLGSGIRVMGIHPGMAETEFSLVRFAGDEVKAKQVYQGFAPLTANDVAEAIVWSLQRPSHVCVETLTLMPSDQASVFSVHRR